MIGLFLDRYLVPEAYLFDNWRFNVVRIVCYQIAPVLIEVIGGPKALLANGM